MTDFNFDLDLNPNGYQSRGPGSMEEDVQLLRRYTNTIGIRSVDIQTADASKDSVISAISFLLVAHPHPECFFEWVRIIVQLDSFPGAAITDLLPKTEKGDQPVKYTISDEKGIAFEATTIKLGPSYKHKDEKEYNVYFDKIIAGGKGSATGVWDFMREPGTRLYLENEMKLKLRHGPVLTDAFPDFKVQAKLKIAGWLGSIPVIGSKLVNF